MHYLDGIPQMTNLGPLTHASNTLFLCFLRGLSQLCAGASFYNTSYLQGLGLNIKQNFRAKKEEAAQKIKFESKRHLVKFLLNFIFLNSSSRRLRIKQPSCQKHQTLSVLQLSFFKLFNGLDNIGFRENKKKFSTNNKKSFRKFSCIFRQKLLASFR